MKAKQFLCGLLSLTLCLGLCACKEESTDPVSVQSVGMITGMGAVGGADRFAGMVDAGESVKVKKDNQLQVKEILVAVGDQVEEGQTLFTYDVEDTQLQLDKMSLEYEQMKSLFATKTQQKQDLEKEKEKAKTEDQLSYTLQIQELQIDLNETELKIAAKEKDIERMKTLLENDCVLAPVSGRIKEINESSGGSDYSDYGYSVGYDEQSSDSNAFITILQTETFRIKGTINEMNINDLLPGSPVTIHSRMDDSYWTGVVESVDWENPVKNENNYFYGMGGNDEMQSASKYPFYITLDSDEGLKLGQHVYIQPGLHTEGDDRLMLPAWCICEPTSENPWVWAANAEEKLEKREIKLGEYNAETDCYELLSGLGIQDYLATPDDNCKAGAPVVFYSESDFSLPMDFGEFGDLEGFEDGEFGGMEGFEGGEFGNLEGFEGGEFGDMEGFENGEIGDMEGFEDGEGGPDGMEPAGGENGQEGEPEAPTEEGGVE